MENGHFTRLHLIRLRMTHLVTWPGEQTIALRAPAVFLLLWSCFWNAFIYNLGAANQGPERWVKAIEAFEREDAEDKSLTGGVMFLGSSSIRMWRSLAEDFPRQKVCNRGFGGSTIPDSLHFFDRIVLPRRPNTIVLYAGDNDVAAGHGADQVYGNYLAFVDRVKKSLPKTKLVFIAIKPSLKRWELAPVMKQANRKVRRHAFWHRGVLYADIWTPMLGSNRKPRKELFIEDGLHLSSAGYEIWKDVLAPLLD